MSDNNQQKKLPLRLRLVGGYLLCMFTLFPVICTDGYFNLRHDRYFFFIAVSIGMLLLTGLCRLLGGSEDKDLPQNLQAVRAAAEGPWYRRLSLTDWAVLLTVAAGAASTALSDYPQDALFGTMGRNNGLVLLAVYAGVYFMLSRLYVQRNYIFAGLALGSLVVSLVALMNFFYLDPLGMHERLSAGDSLIFISTIGNKNLLSSYLCLTLAVTAAAFVHTRHRLLEGLYLVSAFFGFAALMCADSDSGFLGMGAFTVVFLIFYICHVGKLKKFCLVLTVMLLGAKLLFPLFSLWQQRDKGLGDLQLFFVHSTGSTVLLVGLAILTAGLYLLHKKFPRLRLPAILSTGLTLGLGLTVLAVVGIMIYQTTTGEATGFLRLDDRWGTNRGFIWRRSMDVFQDFSWREKLLGSGPDTFYAAFSPYFEEFSQFGNTSTNAAHNEYLNILITRGILGLAAHLTVIIGSLLRALRAARRNSFCLVLVAGVVSYGAQAFVNVEQPITTPLFMIFVALCAGKLNDNAKKEPRTSYTKGKR